MQTAPAGAAHPAGMTTTRDGWSHRSRNNRPPRSPDAEPDFAGARAPGTLPRWRRLCRWRTFRDEYVRTKGRAAAPSLQAPANSHTAVWSEPNALAKRVNSRLRQPTAQPIPGQTHSGQKSCRPDKLAGLLPECNNARLADFATGRQHFASEPGILRFPTETSPRRCGFERKNVR
jgi:hypothetical protein